MTGQRKDPNLDPAVAAILGDAERKRKIREAPKAKAAELRRQAARHRVTLELDPAVVAALRAVAEAEEVTPAAACNWLLGNALTQYNAGDLDFAGAKVPSKSNRWGYTVDLGSLGPKLKKLAKG